MPTLPDCLVLHGERVTLRDWRAEDAPALEAVCGRQEVCRFTSVPSSYERSTAEAWIARLVAGRTEGTTLALAIVEAHAGMPVGNVNLVRFSADGCRAALGYWLAPAARNRGLATCAAQLLCRWGFEVLGLTQIELAIQPENDASHGVAERIGATRQGLRRNSHQADGRWWDMVIYELERPEVDATDPQVDR
jgi:RimJ/RimL family protein N-acetyltransferase